ncbi:MAG: hypothetical protein LC750_07530 [Actinobacteria bacterium]|nr:hypothetical protein [Actinomycetota bacterium]
MTMMDRLPLYECPRGHWTEHYEPDTCMAQDDEYGPGLCGERLTYHPQVGDLFSSSWGYDQTNVDFYEVVEVTKSGKSVRVVQTYTEAIGENVGSVRVVPVPGTVYRDEVPMLKRIRTSYSDGTRCTPAFNIASYADAYLWDGASKYETAQGWGH